MSLKEADKAKKKLQTILNADCAAHGARSNDSIIDSRPIEYFVLRDLVDGYTALREHQLGMRKLLKAVRREGSHIEWYDLDEI